MTTPTRSGLDLRWVDPAVRPQDDLFAHLNGVYLREHEIPADRAQDGAFRDLRDRAEADVRAIVEEAASADGDDATQDRRALRVVHGRRRRRGARHRPAATAARRGRGGDGPGRARRGARPPAAAGAGVAVRHLRQHGREELQPLPRAPEPVGARPARRVVLPRRRVRRDPYRVRRAPRPARRAGRARRPAGAGRAGDGPGDGPGGGLLEPGDQPGRREDLHADDAARAAGERARFRLGAVARGAAGAGRRAGRGRGAPARLRDRRGTAVGAAPAHAVAGVAGDPHGLGVRRLPERRGRAGRLRVLRPHALGHTRAARAVEARRVARGRRAR